MEEKNFNSYHCAFVLHLSIITTTFMTTYSLTSLNPLTPVMRKIYNETYFSRYGESMPEHTWLALLSTTMSIILVGASISSILFKILLNRWTRMQVMIILHITNIVGCSVVAIGCGLWRYYEAFIAGRFITGLALGVGQGILPIIIHEMSVQHRRSLYSAYLGGSYPAGAVIGASIGWRKVFGTDDRWIGVVLFGMVFSFAYLACAYWISETPYQVMLKKGQDEAMKVLRKLRSGEESAFVLEMKGFSDASEDSEESRSETAAEATFLEVLTTPQYRRHFTGAVILFSYITACGLNNIFFFSDRIFIEAGLDPDSVTLPTIGVPSIGPVTAFFAVFAMRCVDPKTMILVGGIIMIIGDAFMTASIATYKEVPVMSMCSVAAMCIFFFGFSIMNSVSFVIIGAITINKTRSVCMNVGASGYWFFAWFVGFMSPYFQSWIGAYAFLIWMVLTIAVSIYTVFYLPNIAGKTPEDVQEFYKNT